MTVRLSTKFMIGMGLIVFLAVGSMSLWFYEYVKKVYVQQTFQKTDLVFGHVDATMKYIKDELRPKMFHILPKDQFVLEAMSTSFVNKGVMSRFLQLFPNYIYRRVALNPMDPGNRADDFERRYIEKFALHPDSDLDWKGLVSRGDREFFIHLKGVVMERECTICHGNPSDSPKSLLARYGSENGHNWPEGKVVGLVSMAIPMDTTFASIRQVAFSVFCAGLIGVALLTLFLYYFYCVVTQRPLQKASDFFKSIVRGEKGLEDRFEVRGRDEISELAGSFNAMIEHLRQSQADLVRSELKYRRIFEGSKDAIIVADATGRIQDINHSGLELLGLGSIRQAAEGPRLADLFSSTTDRDDFFAMLARDGFAKDFETSLLRQTGNEAHVLITAIHSAADEEHDAGYECYIKDITERKQIEMHMRQADKLASIGQLAAGVAHEINNPLSIVLGYTRLLKTGGTGNPQFFEDLDTISNNAELCKKIVEDLLKFARQSKTRPSEADLHETIESVLKVVDTNYSDSGVEISRDYDATLGMVWLDVGKMQQVFMNVIINSLQAMGNTGMLTIVTRRDADASGFSVSFADTGSGIAPAIRERIFDPFFTTKEPGEGTGLGLTVSFGIVEEHGGRISFQSEPGKGALCSIWLPLSHRAKKGWR